ncbi:MAG TPA: 50S ribosomal protein L11 methyltransferase [Candidatus Ozemobacteraceae bacterium]|nr:50S ribosomal protein L11 methyltransferase [Candidatus Ozemobacteraceae bacterium]
MLRRFDITVTDRWEEPLLGLAERLGVQCFSSPCLETRSGKGGEEEIRLTGKTIVSFLASTVEQPIDQLEHSIRLWLQRNIGKAWGLSTKDYRDNEDWMQSFRAYFQPIQISPHLWIRPPWHEPLTLGSECLQLQIDPGMAFGTGTHETTRLCLQLLGSLSVTAGSFLDIGAGSGILAFYLLKSGARRVEAIEIDGPAIENLRKNAALNGIRKGLSIVQGDIYVYEPPWPIDGLVANISSPVLLDTFSRLEQWLPEKGWAVFSGVNSTNAPAVRQGLKKAGLAIDREVVEGEWHGFLTSRATDVRTSSKRPRSPRRSRSPSS